MQLFCCQHSEHYISKQNYEISVVQKIAQWACFYIVLTVEGYHRRNQNAKKVMGTSIVICPNFKELFHEENFSESYISW